jgi:hypothetical protein
MDTKQTELDDEVSLWAWSPDVQGRFPFRISYDVTGCLVDIDLTADQAETLAKAILERLREQRDHDAAIEDAN